MNPKVKKRIIIYSCIIVGVLFTLFALPWIIVSISQKANGTVKPTKTVRTVELHDEELEAVMRGINNEVGCTKEFRLINNKDGTVIAGRVNGSDFNYCVFKSEYVAPIEQDGVYYYRDYAEEGMYADFEIIYSSDGKYALVNFGGNKDVEEAFKKVTG